MDNKIDFIYPTYLDEFKCIGGACEDSCCIGWDVDIDKATYRKYFKVSDKDMKRNFQKNIYKNEDSYDDEIDYGKVRLKENKRCPFLDENNYCIIQANLGEEYLSNVCSSFPRISNKIDNHYEISLNVSCPEAARIILLKKEGIDFKEGKRILGKYILSSSVDTRDKTFENSSLKYVKEIRKISIDIMKNRKYTLSERFFCLGNFLEKIQMEIDYNFDGVENLLKNFNIDFLWPIYKKDLSGINIQINILKNMIDDLNVFSDVDSISFKEYTSQTLKGLGIDENNGIFQCANSYKKGYEEYFEKFLEENSYIFENYFINFIFKNIFPFSEANSLFDGYIMLFLRYLFIRFYLIGIFNFREEAKIDEVVKFIQSFSKTVEHHKTYLIKLLDYLHENELDNMEFVKTLLL